LELIKKESLLIRFADICQALKVASSVVLTLYRGKSYQRVFTTLTEALKVLESGENEVKQLLKKAIKEMEDVSI